MKTQCPNCKARFKVDDKFAGKQAKCPKCAKPFTIEPVIETPVAAAPPSPKHVETPIQKAKPAAPSVKSPEPIAAPAKIAKPVVPPLPVTSPVISHKPVAPPGKIPQPQQPPKEEKSKAKMLSKTLFVYCWMAVRIIAGALGGFGIVLAINRSAHSILIAAFAAADVFLVLSVIIELALYYKMWIPIQDNQTFASPGKAVALLFVPVFNIYWALSMLTGFADDYNSFIQRRSIKAKELSFVLFLVYAFTFILATLVVTVPMICVFAFVGLISRAFVAYPGASWSLLVIALASGVAHFVMYTLCAIKTCNGINVLQKNKRQASPTPRLAF